MSRGLRRAVCNFENICYLEAIHCTELNLQILAVSARVRFVSCFPLYSRTEVSRNCDNYYEYDYDKQEF